MSTRLERTDAARPPRPPAAASGRRAERELAEQFAASRAAAPGGGAFEAWRERRFADFAREGLPNRRVESWHFTDLRAHLGQMFPLAPGGAEGVAEESGSGLRLPLIDGRPRSDLNLEPAEGVRVLSFEAALDSGDPSLVRALQAQGPGEEDPLVALNGAMADRGLVIDIAPGTRLKHPIELVWLHGRSDARSVHSRCLLRLGQGAEAALLESFGEGSAPRQLDCALVVELGQGAVLDLGWSAPRLPASSTCIASVLVRLQAGARLTATSLTCDSPYVRRQTFVSFEGQGAEATLNGLSLLRGSDHSDSTLVVVHAAAHCRSRELFKHVIDDSARGVFQGKIVVAAGAQKTDGSMASRAVLLSDEAGMDNKPELEIFADDVICGHGATCGELDRDQIFYAMSRGMPRAAAEALLLEAFALEALEGSGDEGVRETLAAQARGWLARREAR